MRYVIHTLLVFLVVTPIWAENNQSEPKGDYWQCLAVDKDNKNWSSQNAFKRIAMYRAFESCKKESTNPSSCKNDENACQYFGDQVKTLSSSMNYNSSAQWQCTALDKTAKNWSGNPSSNQDDAALNAKAACRAESTIPDTCYVNMLTCVDMNNTQAR